MKLGTWTAALAMITALGCDDGKGEADAGPTQGEDAATVDAGEAGDDDAGAADGGADSGAPVDGGTQTCPTTLPELGVEEIAPGAFSERLPVGVVQPPGESEDLYVIDQRGAIVIVRDGSVLSTPFIDLGSRTDSGGAPGSERGLLGLAFHPDYATNGRFFLSYTANERGLKNIVAEYHASGDVADPDEVRRLIDIDDPYSNHNGGHIAFGPDGFLYVAMGDGGSGGDPGNRALDRSDLLGKLLRLDVDNESGDFAAAGNPFASGDGLPQIWAYGLRNPWRFSFDRATGDLWIGDVGQNAWEEINFQPASSTGGENYGWSAYEGTSVFNSSRVAQAADHTPPVLEYAHSSGASDPIRNGRSVIAGYVYRGTAIPELRAWHVFGDGYTRDRAAFRFCDGEVTEFQRIADLSAAGVGPASITAFGEDNAGELYMTGFSPNSVVRIVAR